MQLIELYLILGWHDFRKYLVLDRYIDDVRFPREQILALATAAAPLVLGAVDQLAVTR